MSTGKKRVSRLHGSVSKGIFVVKKKKAKWENIDDMNEQELKPMELFHLKNGPPHSHYYLLIST